MSSGTGTSQHVTSSLEWRTKLIMLGGGVMTALALSAITSVLPQIEADLARSPDDSLLIKQLVGIVGLSMVIGAPLAGFLGDRVGLRRVGIATSVIYFITGTAGLYLDSLPALLASRLLLGIVAAAIATMSLTLINTRLEGIDRAKWNGAHVGVAMISTIVIHPFAGYLGEFGWRWPFALYALGLPMALLAMGLEPTVIQRSHVAAKNRGPGVLNWFPLRFAMLAIVIGSITYMPMVYIPFVMRELGVSSPTIVSLVLTGDVVLAAALAMLYGRSQRYLSTHAAFTVSFACAGSGMLIAAIATDLFGVVSGMMVFGLGLGWFVPNLMNAVAQRVSLDQQGRAVGLVKAAHYVAAPLSIIVVEPFAKQSGPGSALLAAAALSFALLILFGYITIARRQRNRAAPAVRQHMPQLGGE